MVDVHPFIVTDALTFIVTWSNDDCDKVDRGCHSMLSFGVE